MSADCSHKPNGLLLALCGTEERLHLVLGQPGRDGYTLLSAKQWTVPGQSIRFLTPGLKAMLDEFDVGVEAIEKIACVNGPGSFTGLRLTLAAAEGIAAANNLPMAGVDYLPLLASGPAPLISGTLHVLTYARRGLVYLQSFSAPDFTPLNTLESLALKDAASRMTELGSTAHLMGSGIRKNRDFFAGLADTQENYTLLDQQWDNPSSEILLEAAGNGDFSEMSIDPVYVRVTDAEENLPQFALKRGMDPVKAQKRLKELQKR